MILILVFIFLPFVFGTSPPFICPDLERPELEIDDCIWASATDFYGCDIYELQCDPGLDATCYQSPLYGNCDEIIERWYFDPKDKRCLLFIYSGCGGNTNNFATQEECQKRCTSSVPTCSHLPYSGPCQKELVRYFYDRMYSECRSFIFGGCNGNGNNFESHRLCQSACKETAPCPIFTLTAPPEGCQYIDELDKETFCPVPKIFCPDDSQVKPGKCPVPSRGKSGACRVNCKTDLDCQGDEKCCRNSCGFRACVSPKPTLETVELCHLPKAPGNCKGSFMRYYFNHANGKCETFIYGGCQDNGNNFESLEECQQKCGNVPPCQPLASIPSSDPYCELTIGPEGCPIHVCLTNPCAAVLCLVGTKCVVENKEAKCVPFETPRRCLLPKDSGPCEALVKSWYYDTDEKECLQFDYGGCEGNRNRFSSKEQCERVCAKKQEKPGSCPKPPPYMGGICVEACGDDVDCDNSLKCCSNGCGHSCVEPESDPCESNPCKSCEKCIKSPKFCITTPCPQYDCIEDSFTECDSHFDSCDLKKCTKIDNVKCEKDSCDCRKAQYYVEIDNLKLIIDEDDC